MRTLIRSYPDFFAFGLSFALLAGAYAFQYIGGYEPCELCWTQRYAHFAILALASLSIILRFAATNLHRPSLFLLIPGFGYSVYISGFHAGVEQKWWQGPSSCTVQPASSLDIDQILDNLMAAPLVSCDEIPWSLFGISMAGYNFLISLLGLLLILWALKGASK